MGYCYLANLFIFTVLILGTTPSHNGDELAGTKQSLIPFLCAGFRLGQPEAALGGLLDILGMCPSMGTGLCGLVVFGIWISGKQSARKKKDQGLETLKVINLSVNIKKSSREI